MTSQHRRLDLRALGAAVGVALDDAFGALASLYAEVDERNRVNTTGLDLPCKRGCDACCHESVFLTPLEFLFAWDEAQRLLDDATLDAIVVDGLGLYERHRELILAFDRAPPAGAQDHFALARQLRFRCPLLGPEGTCRVYGARELYARLFGCSFEAEGAVYGCNLVGAHLADKTVKLLSVRPVAERLQALPLTFKRQVYPYYVHWLYG